MFVVIGFCYRLTRHHSDTHLTPTSSSDIPLAWLVFCALAFTLYWPALFIGFLSDDFGLIIPHVSAWNIGPITAELFRPVPLLIWAVLLEIGAGAESFHALNIVLHGTNAYFTARFVSGWISGRNWSLLAGLVLLTMPLAPEAVAWCTGVFDVMATTFVLGAVLTARRYQNSPTVWTRFSLIGLSIIALLCKETAAIVPLLVLLDAWVRRKFSRRLLLDVSVVLAVMVVVSLVRLTVRFGVTTPRMGTRFLRRAVFRSFGALGFPWHIDVLQASTLLPLLAGLLVIGVVAAFLLHAGRTVTTRAAVASVGWILATILPVFHFLYVAPDLQSSRYLYMASVGWAALLVILGSDVVNTRLRSRVLPRAAMLLLAAIAAFGVRIHLKPWVEAGSLRDLVERQATQDRRMRTCERITLANLPDSVRGAYVFRVGARDEFQRILGVNVWVGSEAGPCSFKWNDRTSAFFPTDN